MSSSELHTPASCLYVGAVRHRRREVRPQTFRHQLALAYIDLEELPALLGGRLVSERPGLIRFRRGDYLGDPRVGLRDAVQGEVERQTGVRPQGPIRVLTQLRSFGHCFNPVSFYFCFDPTGGHVQHVLAEVSNTPWGRRHAYVLSGSADDGRDITGESLKELHVSPFMDMEQHYSWRVSAPAQRLEVHIENRRKDGSVAFDATLALRRRELTSASLRRVTARYPAATLRVLALIYAHAVRLKLRGVPVHPNPHVGAPV